LTIRNSLNNAFTSVTILVKKEVEQAQDNLMQAQQSVATLEKKIQADNQAIDFCFNESISLGAMPGLPLATIFAQQTVATLEKKIQADNQAIEQQTQAEETAKQAIQKEQEEQAKTSNEIKQRQAENEAAIKEKIETEKSLKKLQNTQRSHKPAKKATKEEDQIAKNILAAKVNEARKLDGEKKRIVKATTDALTTANQQLQETEKTIETANKALIL
jgi:hypothetical protein